MTVVIHGAAQHDDVEIVRELQAHFECSSVHQNWSPFDRAAPAKGALAFTRYGENQVRRRLPKVKLVSIAAAVAALNTTPRDVLDRVASGEIGADVASDQLRLFIERIERIEEEMKGQSDDRKDVYAEAKSQGYDPKTMRQIVRLRKMEKGARQEAEALLDTYKSALGLG